MSKIDDFEKKFEKQEVVQKNSNTKYTVIGIAVVAIIFLILFGIALLIHSSIENSTTTSSKESKKEKKEFVDVLQIIPRKSSLEEIQELLDDDGYYYESLNSYDFEIYYADSYDCNLSVNIDSDTELVDYFSLWITYVDKYDYEDALEKILDEYSEKFGTPTPQYDDKTKELNGYLWTDFSSSINNTGFQYVHIDIMPSTYSDTIIYIYLS